MVAVDFMYEGGTLLVDLDSGKTETVEAVELDEAGPGLAAGLALLEEHKDSDPLVLGSGLLTGTCAPASCLGFVLGVSPLSGGPAVSPLNLFAGAEVKLSGFAMVVVKGKSSKPVYLWLHDGVADLVDASKLKGKDTWETTDGIRAEMGEHLIQVISIGPAGESGSQLASYSINYWGSGDNAGLGALMGEKKMKAVALRGLGMLDADEPEEFYEKSKELVCSAPADKGFNGICKTLEADDVDAWLKPITHRYRSCFACPGACNTFVKYNEDPGVLESGGVEEPGMLVTGAAPALWLLKGGWEPEPACRALEALAREGMDLLRGARELSGKPIKEAGEISAAVRALLGKEKPAWPAGKDISYSGLFGAWAPPLADDAHWVAANRTGYVLGICPIFLMRPGADTAGLLKLCGPAAGVELDAGKVEKMFS